MSHVIIGAGEQTANMVDLFNVDYKFIFDEPLHPGERKYDLPVFNFNPFPEEDLRWISSVGATRHKRDLIRKAMALPKQEVPKFTNLTHPLTTIAKTATRGRGVYMQPYSAIYARAKVGNHALLCGACNVGHHSDVGDYCTLGHQAFLAGHVTLEDGVFLGAGVKIKEGIIIGEGALIGMGAVVTNDVPANEVWIGVPAKPMKDPYWPSRIEDGKYIMVRGTYRESDRPNKMLEPWT